MVLWKNFTKRCSFENIIRGKLEKVMANLNHRPCYTIFKEHSTHAVSFDQFENETVLIALQS